MSHEATNWAIKVKGLRPIAKIVLWHLADCHNPTMGCFPTQDYLAQQAEISRASVNRVLDELEVAGIIRREQQHDSRTKQQRATRYHLGFEEGFEPLDIVARVSSSDTAPCLNSDESRVSETAKAVSHSSETRNRGTSNRTSKSEPVSARAALREEFEINIWGDFPQNPNSDPVSAFEAYAALSPADRTACMRGVARLSIRFEETQTDEPLDQRLKFHPHLGKWIRERRWEAELAVA